jgi:phosphotriesterase-related protein
MTEIMTVTGAISPEDLGLTSMHEHILYDGSVYRKRFQHLLPPQDQLPVKEDDPVTLENIYHHRQNLILSWDGVSMHDEDTMLGELTDFKNSGGSAMIDVSVPGLRSNLPAIRRLSQDSGIFVIPSTGLYSEDSWPDRFRNMSVKGYEQYMIKEITDGIEDTGIKAGHIKVAIEGGPTEQEIKLLKAAAHVSSETGLSISIHTGALMDHNQIRDVVSLVLDEGIVPARTVMCHMQHSIACMDLKKLVQDPSSRQLSIDFNKEMLDKGFIAGHDCFGHEYRLVLLGWLGTPEWQNLAAIYELCQLGYSSQITLATDTFLKIQTRRFGGGGYSHLTTSVLPLLREVGVCEQHINDMIIKNPARILAKG